MSEAKPTPGPWFVTPVGTTLDEGGERVVAQVTAGSATGELIVDATYLEDARLIAAAPDLLAALDDIVRSEWTTSSLLEMTPQHRRRLERARAAIAKAEGRS